MEDTQDTQGSGASVHPPAPPDAFSKLPTEILQSIFTYLTDSPPPPLSRRLLPHTRAARLHAVDLTSFRQLELFCRCLRTVPGVGRYVRTLAVKLNDATEALLSKENPSLQDLLVETFALLPSVKEVQAADFHTTSFVLSENAAYPGTPNLRSTRALRLAALLAQLNTTDFLTYRLALLSNYTSLRALEIMILPYDPGSATATAFDLFPASDDPSSLPPLNMAPISHLTSLSLGGPMCDQRIVNLLRAFSSLAELSLFDSFASPHITPALSSIEPSSLRKLRLQRLIATPPPVNLPPSPIPTDWTRFAQLEELVLGMPLCDDDLPPALQTLPHLRHLAFNATSNPSAAQVRALLTTHRPPALQALVLSHVTGGVGQPISAASLPSIHLWLDAVRASSADPDAPTPIFPLLDWHLAPWTPSFTHSDAEALIPLARQVGIHLGGTVISACLTTYVLERQLDIWTTEGAAEGLGEEEKEALGKREFWDALALRYKGRLLGEEQQQPQPRVEEGMDLA
ncbi:hypothetical protein JCM6882_000913 [Rhodosporidiobolus microsporus]